MSCYCERPTADGLATDLWQRQRDEEWFSVITEGGCVNAWMDLPVRNITVAELASKRIWLRNWQCMLPLVIATRDAADARMHTDLRRLVRQPMALATIERELVTGDPTLLRGCLFRMLLDGELKAHDLHVEALSLSTRIGPGA